MLQAFDLLEFGFNDYLPLHVSYDPNFLELKLCAGLCTAWSNDFFSFEKETMSSDEKTNLIYVLQSENRCSIEEAVKIAISIHNEEIENFIYLTKVLSEKYQEHEIVRLYIDGLQSWISGAFDWSSKTYRYKSDNHIFNELSKNQSNKLNSKPIDDYISAT